MQYRNLVRRCDEDPDRLAEACAEFAGLPYVKSFQTGMLTPILNALRPEEYLLVNYKSRQTINYFSGEAYGLKLTEYPSINRVGRRLVEELLEDMDQPGAPDLSDADRFDVFSHWLVAERNYPFPDKRRRGRGTGDPPTTAPGRPPQTLAILRVQSTTSVGDRRC